MITVASLTKTFGALTAVNRLSFTVAPGEIVGLIGPNGAGKTSTFRCMVGIQAPTSGTIAINGHDIVGSPVEAKRQIAFIADEPQLFEYLTVREHLRLVARIYQVSDAEPRARALIEQLQLAGKEQALPGASRIVWAVAGILAASALGAGQLVVQNAVALMFPAWSTIGDARSVVENMGQSMLVMFGSMLALAVGLLPAALAGGVAAAAVGFTGANPALVGVFAASIVLFAECAIAVQILGRVFERTDVTAVPRVE